MIDKTTKYRLLKQELFRRRQKEFTDILASLTDGELQTLLSENKEYLPGDNNAKV